MATKKAVGAVSNGRDSVSKRLGVKAFAGETVTAGSIIIRQKGNKFEAGDNVYAGVDFSLHAKVAGKVEFSQKRHARFDGSLRRKTFVSVVPASAA